MKIWKKWSKTAAMLMVASACMFTGMSTTAFANVDEAAVAEAEQQAAQNEQAAVQPEAKPPETETKSEAEGEKDKPFSVREMGRCWIRLQMVPVRSFTPSVQQTIRRFIW